MYVSWRSISAVDETANDSGCYQNKMLDIHGGLPTLLDDARLVNVCVRVDSCFFLSIEFFTEIHCTIFGNYELKKISGNIWVCGWVLGWVCGVFVLQTFLRRGLFHRTFFSFMARIFVLFDCKILRHPASPGTGKCGTNIMCNLQPVLTFLHH